MTSSARRTDGPPAAAKLDGKAWHSLRARAALAGLTLLRSHPADGPARLLIQRFGAWREVRNLDDLEDLVVQAAGGAQS